MAHERTCYVSKKHKYEYCNKCDKYKHLPSYMFTYCSENCRDIDRATADYANGHITVEEAKELLQKCDLSDFENFEDVIKNIINEINEKTTSKNTKKKIVNDDLLKTEDSAN